MRLAAPMGLAVMLAALAGAATVSAGVYDIRLMDGVGFPTSEGVTKTGRCSPGQKVIGTNTSVSIPAADIRPFGQVVIDDLRPSRDLTEVVAKLLPDEDGISSPWNANGSAICADPPAGLELASATSPLSSANKSVTTPCPQGKRVLGSGAEINAGSGLVLLDDIRPNPALTAVTVQAVEQDTGTSGLWSVTAHAICADPILGLERRARTSLLNSDGGKNADAGCGDKAELGGGTDINAGVGQVALVVTGRGSAAAEDQDGYDGVWSLTDYTICAPTRTVRSEAMASSSENKSVGASCFGSSATGIGGLLGGNAGNGGEVSLAGLEPGLSLGGGQVTGVEDETGTQDVWNLSTYVVCGTSPGGLERAQALSPLNSVSPKQATASCPAGKRVVGAAATLNAAAGQVLLDDIRPNAGLTGVTVQGVEDETGYSGGWSIFAFAICAQAPAGLERVAETSALDSAAKGVTASCPGVKRLLGGGADVNGGAGQVVLTGIRPAQDLRSQAASAAEDETGAAQPWSVTGYAICADP